jgi:LmeA-like phospholipid-binding
MEVVVARADGTVRKHRGLRILIIVVLSLVVLLFAADRIGALVAERTVAKETKTQLASDDVTFTGDPKVSIHGFPFLTQVISGHYQRIDITVPDPASRGVRLDSLTVSARNVNASTGTLLSGNGQIEADSVVGTGQLGWASFMQLVDLSGVRQYGIDPKQLKIGSTDSGNLSIEAPANLHGQSFNIQATGKLSVNKNVLHVAVSNVTTSDSGLPSLLQPVLAAIAKQLTFDVRIPQLPYRLVLDTVRANPNGIAITASAHDVVLGG